MVPRFRLIPLLHLADADVHYHWMLFLPKYKHRHDSEVPQHVLSDDYMDDCNMIRVFFIIDECSGML